METLCRFIAPCLRICCRRFSSKGKATSPSSNVLHCVRCVAVTQTNLSAKAVKGLITMAGVNDTGRHTAGASPRPSSNSSLQARLGMLWDMFQSSHVIMLPGGIQPINSTLHRVFMYNLTQFVIEWYIQKPLNPPRSSHRRISAQLQRQTTVGQ